MPSFGDFCQCAPALAEFFSDSRITTPLAPNSDKAYRRDLTKHLKQLTSSLREAEKAAEELAAGSVSKCQMLNAERLAQEKKVAIFKHLPSEIRLRNYRIATVAQKLHRKCLPPSGKDTLPPTRLSSGTRPRPSQPLAFSLVLVEHSARRHKLGRLLLAAFDLPLAFARRLALCAPFGALRLSARLIGGGC